MGDLGDGTGSAYSAALDTDTVQESTSTSARADVPNDLAAAIVAIQNELGTDPAGSLTDVKTWLQTEHSADGTHADVDAATLSVSGIADFADGTASAPSITNTGDANTGIYFSAANTIDMTTDGTNAFSMDANQDLTLAGDVTMGGASTPRVLTITSSTESSLHLIDTGGSAQAWKVGLSVSGNTNNLEFYDVTDSRLVLSLDGDGDATFAGDILNSATSKIATGGETAPDVDGGGLCLNHGAADGNVLTFKNSDVAHGVTDGAETDTYAQFAKASPTTGGLVIEGYVEDIVAIRLQAVGTTGVTTKSTAGSAPLVIQANKKSGTTTGAYGANENLAVIRNFGNTRFIFDGDGDSHQDVGTAWTNFDDEDDALAVRGLMGTLEKNSAKKQLFNMVKYNAQKLHDMGVITYTPKDKSPSGQDEMFLSNKGILGLYGGAISELYGVAELMAKRLGTNYEAMKQEYRGNQLQ